MAPTLFVLGDSISIQYGPHLKRFLGDAVRCTRKGEWEASSDDPDLACDANGGNSDMVLDYLRARRAGGGIPADLLLLNVGLWDLRTWRENGEKDVPLPRYRENLAAILDLAKQMFPRVVWVRITPYEETVHNRVDTLPHHRYNADLPEYNGAADEALAAAGLQSIDLHSFTLTLGDDLYCDHVHFNESIRELQGAHIAGYVRALLG